MDVGSESTAENLRAAFACIDWRAPWFAPLAQPGARVAQRIAHGASVAAALNDAATSAPGTVPFRFAQQEALASGMAYETFIYERRRIPTRDNAHDFFNGLIWLRFPRTKQVFNQWQASAIAQQGIGAVRGPLRDAITVFDENGALLIAPPALREALRARDWTALGCSLRANWQHARLLPFGHALLEKLLQPRKSITAHVYVVDDPALECAADDATVDAWMAAHFQPQPFAAKPFNPLPVLGVPGWWHENENFCFYDDSFVFRSARRTNTQQRVTAAAG